MAILQAEGGSLGTSRPGNPDLGKILVVLNFSRSRI
jgi:hypothetical protein